MSSPLDWIADELAALDKAQLLRRRVSRSGKQGAKIVIDGKRYLNFASNDYLGIAADPQVEEIVERTVLRGGWGSGASPLVVGRSALHAELERRLATYLGCEAALLFPTGFAANSGTLPCLAGKQDVIFSDAKNHASLIDGCRLAGARIAVYPHVDMTALESLLAKEAAARRKLIVSDGLFSMDGDLAPIDDLVRLAEAHGAMLLIDEAHALGVQGVDGRGVAAEHSVDVRVGTLSKSFGSQGGFVAGSKQLIDYLGNRARSYVFSTASPAATAAVALAALQIMRDEPQRRERLLDNAQHLRKKLLERGWQTTCSNSHILPIVLGDPARALELAERLQQQKLWVPCIRPPAVPQGESLLRISLSSFHTREMLDQLLDALSKVR